METRRADAQGRGSAVADYLRHSPTGRSATTSTTRALSAAVERVDREDHRLTARALDDEKVHRARYARAASRIQRERE
jgi:hypothetical protein